MSSLLETSGHPEHVRSILLSTSADPDAAGRYVASFRSLHSSAYERLCATPAGLHILIAVFSQSRFLSEEVMQHPGWIEDLVDSPDLYRVWSPADFVRQLDTFLGSPHEPPGALLLAIFRRRQLLRILVRDVMGYATLSEVTEELSNLSDAILNVTYKRIRDSLAGKYGVPRLHRPGGESEECEFSVLALGKLGGRELNYSSDIDLMFLYSGNGKTDGSQSISNKEFFKKIANLYTDLLSTYTVAGMCYRVDLRLRPDGRLGEICLSVEGAKHYYDTRARDWELQMLIKARTTAGDPAPGRQLLEHVQPRIYSSTLDFSAVEGMSATRERIHEKLHARQRGKASGLDIKLARGGIRDIEFLVQCLQRLHGGREPWVRQGGTLVALLRLRDKDLLSDAEYARLASAYQFFRHLEHRLQFRDDRQTHTLPTNTDELTILARRMPASEVGRSPSADKFLHQLNLHLEEVQETYDRVIHSQQPLYYSEPSPGSRPQEGVPAHDGYQEPGASNLLRFLDQRAPGLAACLAHRPLQRGYRSFEHLLERIYSNGDILRLLDENCSLAQDTIELFESSPFFADELIRHPELIEELGNVRDRADRRYINLHELLPDVSHLRRFFRREMLRMEAASICLRIPIFDTLGRTSDLADAVIGVAYALARDQVSRIHPPAAAAYRPGDQMVVIAMGRLGMREFDLGSDADLNFVLPDADGKELEYWTRVAERMIDLIAAYTGEGVMFTVDTRLRPNGREGQLVQTVNAYKDYLLKNAEAWEGITYMKSRAVAGNTERGTEFLHELQEVDWRRYGQSGRSRTDLRNMRARLEREQGSSSPLKAGFGGYYDIDFILMYLRLRSAGIFYRVLNTPERIDIIEKMGHLDRSSAEFLNDAASFYRAIDHGLRLYFGHAEGRLPQAETQLATLADLVHRWTPERLHDKPILGKLDEIQGRTRQQFKKLFG